jgi:hypothetical protein
MDTVILGGVMVSVLAIGLGGFLRALNICSMLSFRVEVKPSPPWCKILWHVNEPSEIWTKTLCKNKFIISFASSSYDFWYFQRALVDEAGFPVNIIPLWFSILISHWGMNNRPFGGHSSETQSHPITMIVINMYADWSEANFAPSNGTASECPPVNCCYTYDHKWPLYSDVSVQIICCPRWAILHCKHCRLQKRKFLC